MRKRPMEVLMVAGGGFSATGLLSARGRSVAGWFAVCGLLVRSGGSASVPALGLCVGCVGEVGVHRVAKRAPSLSELRTHLDVVVAECVLHRRARI